MVVRGVSLVEQTTHPTTMRAGPKNMLVRDAAAKNGLNTSGFFISGFFLILWPEKCRQQAAAGSSAAAAAASSVSEY